MLWPYTKRLLVLGKTHPEHLPVVIRDVHTKYPDFQGYVSLLGDDINYTLLLHDNRIIQNAVIWPNNILIPNPQMNEYMLKRIGENTSIIVMELDNILMALLSVIFSKPADISISSPLVHYDKMIEESMERSDFFLVTVFHEMTCTTAVFEDGEVPMWFKYSDGEGGFVRSKGVDSFFDYMESIKDSEYSICVYLDPQPVAHDIEIFKPEDDPFLNTAKAYQELFEQILMLIVNRGKGNALKEVQDLLAAFKKKYKPLYQGVFINPETMQVNWEKLFENRLKISHKFRYDAFFLYMDELLLALIRKLYAMAGIEGIVAVIHFVDKRRKSSLVPAYHLTGLFYSKLNSLLKIDRYSANKAP